MTTAGRSSLRLTAILSLLAAATIFVASCNAGGGHRRDDQGNLIPTARELDPARTFSADTMDAAAKGDSANNTEPLTCFAIGRGSCEEGVGQYESIPRTPAY